MLHGQLRMFYILHAVTSSSFALQGGTMQHYAFQDSDLELPEHAQQLSPSQTATQGAPRVVAPQLSCGEDGVSK